MAVLAGAVAIVTGGGRGIGRAIALAYAREGASVVVAARTRDEVEAVAAEIAAAGGASLALTADVGDAGDVARMADATLVAFGRVDVLVNNAGVPGPHGLPTEFAVDEWERTLRTNATGAYLCCRAVLPGMMARRRGNIVNVSSGAGLRRTRDHVRSLPYAVSKFAMEGLTHALAVQVRPYGVNVNSLLPGPIATWFHDATPPALVAGSLGTPEDVVPAALRLAALRPGEMTGESVRAREVR